MIGKIVKMGKKGTVVIPKEVRDSLHLAEGTPLVLDVRDSEIVMRSLIPEKVKLKSETIQRIVREAKREELSRANLDLVRIDLVRSSR